MDYGHAEASHKYGSDPRKYNVMSKKFLTDEQGHVRVSCSFSTSSFWPTVMIATLMTV